MIQLMEDFVDENGKLNLKVSCNKTKLINGEIHPKFYPIYNKKIVDNLLIESGFDPDTLGFNVVITEININQEVKIEVVKKEIVKTKFEKFKTLIENISSYNSKTYLDYKKIVKINVYEKRISLIMKENYLSFDENHINNMSNNNFESLLKSISVTKEMINYFNGINFKER